MILSDRKCRQILARKVNDLLAKTQAIPEAQEITEEENALEIEAYLGG
ncbi:hypothetical protein QUB08_07915 [Microcoleus sp. BR0-C5]